MVFHRFTRVSVKICEDGTDVRSTARCQFWSIANETSPHPVTRGRNVQKENMNGVIANLRPHPVTRGRNVQKEIMNGIIHLDTLYLIVKYPYLDVFKKWFQQIEGIDYRMLKEGIASGDFVIRNGSSCYKYSLWQHDARIFLTDQVDEKVGDGNGSGVWVQLGPKFIIQHF
jgi:hypothetical protein